MSIQVIVADDHQVVRSGLRCLFSNSDIRIISEAATGMEAVEQTLKHRPDVALLDVRMPDGDGLEALEKIRGEAEDQRIVMLSTFDNPTYVARSVALGANDYVLKGANRHVLVGAISRVANGEEPAEDSIWRRVQSSMERRREKPTEFPLTSRELQVLRHLALGLSNREIGRSLGISIETVKEHVQNVLRKVKACDRTQAAVWAVREKLV